MEEKKDLFDLTFTFILVFVVIGFLVTVPLNFFFGKISDAIKLYELQVEHGFLVFYISYFIEMFITAILVAIFGTNAYLKVVKIEPEHKQLLLRNVAIFLLLMALFPNILEIFADAMTTLIYLLLNSIIFGSVYLYFSKRIT